MTVVTAVAAPCVCPACHFTDDRREFRATFCPSRPDRCSGCEIHEDRLICPACEHEWEITK